MILFIKKFEKFTGKPRLAYFLYLLAYMASLMLRYSLIIENFATSWVRKKYTKNAIKLIRRFFLHKSNKKCKKTTGEMFCIFAGTTSLTLNSKLYNFITSRNLIKTPQNYAQGSFSIKLTKICHENRVEVLTLKF